MTYDECVKRAESLLQQFNWEGRKIYTPTEYAALVTANALSATAYLRLARELREKPPKNCTACQGRGWNQTSFNVVRACGLCGGSGE